MWVLIRKDLLRRWRSPLATIVMIIFPLFMSLAIGSISGGGGGGSDFPRIKVLLQNNDTDGFLSNAIMGAAGQGEGQEYLELVEVGAEGVEMMEDGKASALVVLPEDFTAKVFNRDPVEITVVRNPAEGIKPEIVAQGADVVATYLDQSSRLLGEELGIVQVMMEAENIPASTKVGAVAAGITTKIAGVEKYLFPPLVELGSVKEGEEEEEEESGGGNVFGYVLIMTTVMALLFVATRSMGDLFEERNNGMLKRQLGTPMGIGLIVGAKMVFGVVFGVIVLAILGAIGLTFRWIEPPVDLLGALLLGLSFSLAGCGLLALIFSLVKTEKQVGILGWLVIMGMSAIGGSMMPYDSMAAPLQAAAKFTINYWAIDGFTRLVFTGAGLGDITGNITRLLAFGAVTAGVGQVLLVRRYREVSP